jgi:hypothetical protein
MLTSSANVSLFLLYFVHTHGYSLTSCHSQGVGLASTCNISAAQLAEIWESHSLNKDISELNDITFKSFRASVLKDAPGATDTAVVSRPALSKRSGVPMVTPPAKRMQSGELKTPVSAVDAVARVSISPNMSNAPSISSPAYNERTGVGKVVFSFNPRSLPKSDSTASTKHRCEIIAAFPTNVSKPFRHMFTPLEEKARALDEHLVTMGEEIVTRYAIGQDEGIADLEAVGVPRQDKVCCLGRICNEVSLGQSICWKHSLVLSSMGHYLTNMSIVLNRRIRDELIKHLSCLKVLATTPMESVSQLTCRK